MSAGEIIKFERQKIDAKKCHNDIKPSNVLYKKTNNSYSIRIADFGQCGGKGGTPGWTAPIFHQDRQPGKEDMYSVGWLILRLLCGDEDLFFCLRDNFVANTSKMAKFRNLPEIQFIMKLIDIENQSSVETILNDWNQIKFKVKLITSSKLISLGVYPWYLQIQYVHSR